MTIQELLVLRGYWPDLDGPKRNVTRGWRFLVYPENYPREQWTKITQVFGLWHKYEVSCWAYFPKKIVKGDVYLDDDSFTIKETTGVPGLIDRGAA